MVYAGVLAVLTAALIFVPFFVWRIHSFWTSVGGAVFGALGIAQKRADLLKPMLVSGLVMVLLALPFYWLGLQTNPNAIQEEWLLENLSGIFIWRLPIEELAWFFMVGFGFSAFWEMAAGVRYRWG